MLGRPDTGDLARRLISLDCTEDVVAEAIASNCQLIISHHPIVFKGLKRFNGKTYVERVVEKAIRNNIAIYAIHTNLDNIALRALMRAYVKRWALKNCHMLAPKQSIA